MLLPYVLFVFLYVGSYLLSVRTTDVKLCIFGVLALGVSLVS